MSSRVHPTIVAAVVLAATGLAAGLTACSSAAAESGRPDPPRATTSPGAAITPATALAAARRVRCPDPAVAVRPLPAESIPAGFAPVAVVECLQVTVPAPAPSSVRTEEKRQVAVGGLAALLRALRLPVVRFGGSRACLVRGYEVPWLVLIGRSGQEIHPAVPLGICDTPVDQVAASLHELRWISLGVWPAAGTGTGPLNTPSNDVESGRPPIQGSPVHRLTPGSPAG